MNEPRPLKILIVVHRFYPDAAGGVERRFFDMATSAMRAGHDVRVVATNAFGPVVAANTPGDVRIDRLQWRKGVDPNSTAAVWEWRRLYRTLDFVPDVVWTANPAAAVACRFSMRRAHRLFMPGQWEPLRLTWQLSRFVHEARRAGVSHGASLLGRRVVTALAARLSTSSPVASTTERAWCTQGAWGMARVQVKPRGIAVDYWSAVAEGTPSQRPPGPLRVLVASRFDRGKNIDHAILACMLSRADVRLTICGSGPDEARLRSIVSEAPQPDRVTFKPWIPDLRPVYQGHDVFVMSSDFEAYGQTVFEALCSGCIVTLRRPDPPRVMIGAAESLESCEACIQYDTYSSASLAATLDDLAKDPVRRASLSAAARAWSMNRSWDAVLAHYLPQSEN